MTKKTGADGRSPHQELLDGLAQIYATENRNYSPTMDFARIDAAGLILKHSGEQDQALAAHAFLATVAASGGGYSLDARVRASRVLLETIPSYSVKKETP